MTVSPMSIPTLESSSSIAAGTAGEKISKYVYKILVAFYQTNIISLNRYEMCLESLLEIQKEYSDKNWDGYGALPVKKSAIIEAKNFLSLIEEHQLPRPDPSPEIDGGVEFEWYMNPKKQFSVSFDGNGLLTYSGIFGEKSETFGIEEIGNSVPHIIQGHILRLYPEYWSLAEARQNRA